MPPLPGNDPNRELVAAPLQGNPVSVFPFVFVADCPIFLRVIPTLFIRFGGSVHLGDGVAGRDTTGKARGTWPVSLRRLSF